VNVHSAVMGDVVEELGDYLLRRVGGVSKNDGDGKTNGFELSQVNSDWGFELDINPVSHAAG
jgi:hypothetical protein